MMRHFRFVWVWVLSGWALAGCMRQDVRTLDIHVPQMASEACARLIVDALNRYTPQVIPEVRYDLARRVVTVNFNSTILATKNIEMTIVQLGFDANGLPGDPAARARLPEGCRP